MSAYRNDLYKDSDAPKKRVFTVSNAMLWLLLTGIFMAIVYIAAQCVVSGAF